MMWIGCQGGTENGSVNIPKIQEPFRLPQSSETSQRWEEGNWSWCVWGAGREVVGFLGKAVVGSQRSVHTWLWWSRGFLIKYKQSKGLFRAFLGECKSIVIVVFLYKIRNLKFTAAKRWLSTGGFIVPCQVTSRIVNVFTRAHGNHPVVWGLQVHREAGRRALQGKVSLWCLLSMI